MALPFYYFPVYNSQLQIISRLILKLLLIHETEDRKTEVAIAEGEDSVNAFADKTVLVTCFTLVSCVAHSSTMKMEA
jgi:hypothetical protein